MRLPWHLMVRTVAPLALPFAALYLLLALGPFTSERRPASAAGPGGTFNRLPPTLLPAPDPSTDECEPPEDESPVTELDPQASPVGRSSGPAVPTTGRLPAAFWPSALLACLRSRHFTPTPAGEPATRRRGHFLDAARALRNWVLSLVC